MKNVFLGRKRTRAVIKVSSLLVLGVVIIVFLATPLVSLAHGTDRISQRNVKANVKTNRNDNNGNDNNGNNGNDNNGNDNNGNNPLQNLLPNLPNLPNLPDGGRLQKLLGGNNGNDNNGNDNNGNDNNGNDNNGNDNNGNNGNGNNPLQNLLGNDGNGLCGIDLSDIDPQDFLDRLSQLFGNGGKSIQARIKASNKQSSSLPIAKLTGIVQFSTIQATKTQATRQTAAAKQDGGLTLTFKIVPEKVVSLNKGDFIQASFDGKVESGLSLGGGKADLFDPVTGLPTTVQLS
jgi:hypothetical protein